LIEQDPLFISPAFTGLTAALIFQFRHQLIRSLGRVRNWYPLRRLDMQPARRRNLTGPRSRRVR
jgi:hypothetical protein